MRVDGTFSLPMVPPGIGFMGQKGLLVRSGQTERVTLSAKDIPKQDEDERYDSDIPDTDAVKTIKKNKTDDQTSQKALRMLGIIERRAVACAVAENCRTA